VEKTRQDNNKLGTVDNFIDKFGKKHKIIFVVAMINVNVNSTASGRREDFRGGFMDFGWKKNSGMGVGKLMEMKTTKWAVIREFVNFNWVAAAFAEDSLGF